MEYITVLHAVFMYFLLFGHSYTLRCYEKDPYRPFMVPGSDNGCKSCYIARWLEKGLDRILDKAGCLAVEADTCRAWYRHGHKARKDKVYDSGPTMWNCCDSYDYCNYFMEMDHDWESKRHIKGYAESYHWPYMYKALAYGTDYSANVVIFPDFTKVMAVCGWFDLTKKISELPESVKMCTMRNKMILTMAFKYTGIHHRPSYASTVGSCGSVKKNCYHWAVGDCRTCSNCDLKVTIPRPEVDTKPKETGFETGDFDKRCNAYCGALYKCAGNNLKTPEVGVFTCTMALFVFALY